MKSSVQALLADGAFWRFSWYHYIALTLLLFHFIRISIRRIKFVQSIAWIPGPPALPIVGNALSLTGGQDEFYRILLDCGEKYGRIFRLWIGMRPFIFVANAEDTQTILSSSVHVDKSYEYSFLKKWLGNGLLLSTGSLWHRRRKLLTPAFHYSILEDLAEPILRQADILLRILEEKVNSPAFDICPFLKFCALDIICSTAMGKEMKSQVTRGEYPTAVERISEIVQRRFITPWLKPDLIFKRSQLCADQENALKSINRFVDSIIEERSNESKVFPNGQGMYRKPAFLDLLLKTANEGAELSKEDIRDEVHTFMFAGHDTTATTVTWCMYLFGKHPQVQEDIIKEYESKIGEKIPTFKDVASLEYLDACVKETMRLYPIVPLIARDIIHEPVKCTNGDVLPVGATVLIHSPLLHRDPDHFENPDEFIPERFLRSNSSNRHPFAFIPFSAGPRNCIGQKFAQMSTKLMVISILRKFEVTSVDPENKLNLTSDLVLTNKGGVNITIKRRKMDK